MSAIITDITDEITENKKARLCAGVDSEIDFRRAPVAQDLTNEAQALKRAAQQFERSKRTKDLRRFARVRIREFMRLSNVKFSRLNRIL